MKKIDLHLHTDCSDGRLSPVDLVELCAKKNYTTISIADHDTLDGYLAVKDLVKKYNIELIPGLEISSYHKGAEVHILVYMFDEENSELLGLLRYINDSRINRAKKIIANLQQAGFNLDFDEIFAKVGDSGIIGRAHISREIKKIEKNLTVNEIFDKYLNENSSLYVPKETFCVKDILPVIKRSGGVTVLAHPHRLRNLSLVYDIIKFGIDGIEAYCPKSSNYYVNLFLKIAAENGLLVTGGSDFHCEHYEEADFGNFSVPESCCINLKRFHNSALVKTQRRW